MIYEEDDQESEEDFASFVEHAPNLTDMVIINSIIDRFVDIEKLKLLEKLVISGSEVGSVEGIGILVKMKSLSIENCLNVVAMPDIGSMEDLVTLSMAGCVNLGSLPLGLGGMKKLETLDVSRCHKIVELLDIEEMTSLENLKIRGCGITLIPDSVASLPRLRFISLNFFDVTIEPITWELKIDMVPENEL